MNSVQAATGIRFANTDPSKAWAQFGLSRLTVKTPLEALRKNASALTDVNEVAFDGLTTLVQRHGDLVKMAVDEYGKVLGDVMATASLEEKATKHAKATRHIFESTMAGFRELCDIATKANVAAVDILNARVTEAFDEFRALFDAPVEPAASSSAVPLPLIAEAVTRPEGLARDEEPDVPVEPAPVNNAAAPLAETEDEDAIVESKAAIKSAARSRTAVPGVKPTRRPFSRR